MNITRIILGLIVGVIGRIVYEQTIASTKLAAKSLARQDDGQIQCPACSTLGTCTVCPPRKIEIKEQSFIFPSYKPKGMYEVTRWLYFDTKHVYDIINDEPKVALKGHWLEEVRAAIQVGMQYINTNRMLGQTWSLVQLHNGYMRTDSLRGTDYMLDVVVKPTYANTSTEQQDRMFRIRMVHPLEEMKNARLVSVQKEIRGSIKVVVPVSPGSKHIEELIEAFVKAKNEEVHLILVLFSGYTKRSMRITKEAILKKTSTHSSAPIKLLIQDGPFNYFTGIQSGAKTVKSSDIVFAIPEDSFYTSALMHHCRSIAKPQKTVYFPVAFGMFNPTVIDKGMPPGKSKKVDKHEQNKYNGYWLHQKHDYICAYQKDFMKILSGLTSKVTSQWIYDAFLHNDIEVFAAVEPNLYKVNSGNKCEKSKSIIEHKQCIKSNALYLGSKPALGILYINTVIQKHN